MNLQILWKNIEHRLNRDLPHWQFDIKKFGQVQAVEERSQGKVWSDDEVFEALLMAVLSANTVWSRIESIQPKLKALFSGFGLEAYAGRQDSDVIEILVPWFQDRKAGSPWLAQNLLRLIDAAQILFEHSKIRGSAESYFTELMEQHDQDSKQVVLCLGGSGSKHKLPSIGVPLAAEALKNLGFDVAKPDVHVCRAMNAFGLVEFKHGKNGKLRCANKHKQLETMEKVEDIAMAAGKPVAYVDNAIWMLGAKEPSGLHLTNLQLAQLAGNYQIQQRDMNGLLALLDSWAKDGDVEEQKETLEYLIQALDENRPEGYKLFPPELKGKTW